MGLKNWFNKQVLVVQNKQGAYLEKHLSEMLEGVIKKKADRLTKEGKPLTLVNLMSKSEALEKLGLNRQDIEAVALKYVRGNNAS
jgi:hypothetical protein